MSLKEISLAQLLQSTSGTSYFSTFAKLIGKKDILLYEGITDDDCELLEELEEELGHELPTHYLELLGVVNGGHFFNMDMFSLADKEYPNSLYSRNFHSNIREELGLEGNDLIIGKYENYVMYVDCEYFDGCYTLMDIRNKDKIEFESFSSLIGFIYYMLIVNGNKKIEEEKKQIKKMKEDLHKDIVLREKMQKKEKQKNREKLMARTAKAGLKKKTRK